MKKIHLKSNHRYFADDEDAHKQLFKQRTTFIDKTHCATGFTTYFMNINKPKLIVVGSVNIIKDKCEGRNDSIAVISGYNASKLNNIDSNIIKNIFTTPESLILKIIPNYKYLKPYFDIVIVDEVQEVLTQYGFR